MSNMIPNTQDVRLRDGSGRLVKIVAWYVFNESRLEAMVWDETQKIVRRFIPDETYTSEPESVDIS